MKEEIPYKIYLEEKEIPTQWYNVRADMKNKPAPLLNPSTGEPLTVDELKPIFCEELCRQELDNDTAYFDIPEDILNFYKMYRPSPLVRAYFLEKALGTPAKIYYKFEGNAPDYISRDLLPEVISSILPSPRRIMPKNRDLRALLRKRVPDSGELP